MKTKAKQFGSYRPLKLTSKESYEKADEWFNIKISSEIYYKYTRSCIYGWFRDEICLYIGQSKRGIQRPFGVDHHIINKVEPVLPGDHFRFHFPVILDETTLDNCEKRYIDAYRPKYNKANNNGNLKPDHEAYLSSMQDIVRAKEKLAEILQCEMQECLLLGDARNNPEILRKLPREDLERRVKRLHTKGKLVEFLESQGELYLPDVESPLI